MFSVIMFSKHFILYHGYKNNTCVNDMGLSVYYMIVNLNIFELFNYLFFQKYCQNCLHSTSKIRCH